MLARLLALTSVTNFESPRGVHTSIKTEWRKELALSMDKVAKMQISWRRSAQGAGLGLVGACGAFLFALMTAEEPDKDLALAVGLTGCAAGVTCIISEIYTVTKRRRLQSQLNSYLSDSLDNLVSSCSWWYVAISFFSTTYSTSLYILYAVTLENWTWKVEVS